ncbi:uncharacterized protein PV09_04252 [Verruconis gallopava]|uniref:GST C-terminal domain-containing protein n=1 Tax=Verruconis gallopava TaxID=253628 RepID=A0A0D2ADH4_9PEZI|nr:uncharacterized protein PV09_04252 [Verruconis gallopava]KIW04495.1 hypothetical protein PV09_04252 [Verruconis gallopava]
MPREVLAKLGVRYRRIPVMAIGKDIYCDSRMIISKLEKLYPENTLGASSPIEQAFEYLLENFINDAGPFLRAAQMIPPSLISPEFAKDRSEMTGRVFEAQGRERQRPEAMAHVRMYFNLFETKILADGRKFISGTDEPRLGDIHAAWNLDWAVGLAQLKQEGEKGDLFTREQYPKVFAWLDRYKAFVASVHEKDGRAETIGIEETVRKVLSSKYAEPEGDVDALDPLQLKKGQLVEMFPTDSGMNHHDKGELLSISADEVVVKSEVPGGKGHLRIHYPRTNFSIKPLQEGKL